LSKERTKSQASYEILSDAEIRSIARRGTSLSCTKNTVVVTEGDRTDTLYIIVSGRVRVYVSDELGKEVTLSEQGPGEYFGEMVLDEGPRSASVIALEPCKFIVVPKADVLAFLAENPGFTVHLIKKLIRRGRTLTENVKSLALFDVYGRVARMLLELAEERDGLLTIERRPTQQDMASRVGASREMVSKIISVLTTGGYLRTEGKRMIIARSLPSRW
jgi:CRP/FNR family cyclic AMP-dependent transcriptional regulator